MRKLMTGAALAAAALTILPSQALAGGKKHGHHKHRPHYSHYDPDYRYGAAYAPAPVYRERYVQRVYERPDRCRSGTTGAIVGAAAGALLGREIDGGRDRAQGTIIGGAAGALLGREATRNC
jgi:uncharacterized protein YcfJ